jgi:hypothetical protein
MYPVPTSVCVAGIIPFIRSLHLNLSFLTFGQVPGEAWFRPVKLEENPLNLHTFCHPLVLWMIEFDVVLRALAYIVHPKRSQRRREEPREPHSFAWLDHGFRFALMKTKCAWITGSEGARTSECQHTLVLKGSINRLLWLDGNSTAICPRVENPQAIGPFSEPSLTSLPVVVQSFYSADFLE